MLTMTRKLTKNPQQWKQIGAALGAARELGGLTQQAAADALGITRHQLLAIEYGERQPRPYELRQMITLYAIDANLRELGLAEVLAALDTDDLAIVYDFARLLLVDQRVKQANARRREAQHVPDLAPSS